MSRWRKKNHFMSCSKTCKNVIIIYVLIFCLCACVKGYIRLLLFIYSNYDEIARLSFYCIVIVQETIEVQCNFGKGKWIRVKYSNSKFPKLIKEQGAFFNNVTLRGQYFVMKWDRQGVIWMKEGIKIGMSLML